MCLFFNCFLIVTWNSHDYERLNLIGISANHAHFMTDNLKFLIELIRFASRAGSFVVT